MVRSHDDARDLTGDVRQGRPEQADALRAEGHLAGVGEHDLTEPGQQLGAVRHGEPAGLVTEVGQHLDGAAADQQQVALADDGALAERGVADGG